MLRSWLKAPARWRHSRGFGIHSPFAYDLIVNTLRERRYGYYLYADIDAGHRDHSAVLKLIVRLLCRQHPTSVNATGSLAGVVTRLARLVDSTIDTDPADAPDMYIVTPGNPDPAVESKARATIAAGGMVIITRERQYSRLAAAMTGNAMTFSNRLTFIAAGRPDLPRQHHDIYF